MSKQECLDKRDYYISEIEDLKELEVNEMLRFLIGVGEEMETLPLEERNDETRVKGCASELCLAVYSKDGNFGMRLYSDALVVRGLLGAITRMCEYLTLKEFVEEGYEIINSFIQSIDMNLILSPTRTNGFGNAIHKILVQAKELV